ncbi:hypothetical protein SAMN06265360_1052 [Haloechinothrix alba]|uniref:DUF3093 domain-containing protein n=1 Tax=Haloechinothrix alba TaxID=664784 RepID=A0A238W0P1_9PSEU|nr:hypothetical protein [Haloechinothrix alba]SNR40086.1 hypothetical protein SAMN06265360_1052 [Haloechinothrix alba]
MAGHAVSEGTPGAADRSGTVLYEEIGATWWPLVWAPGLAVAGMGFDLLLGLRPHVMGWTLAGAVLMLFTALWVYARRRFLQVRLTAAELCQADERVPVDRIDRIEAGADADSGERPSLGPAGTRVLGGGMTPPRKYEELLLRLDDGTLVLAWARDAARLESALRDVLSR